MTGILAFVCNAFVHEEIGNLDWEMNSSEEFAVEMRLIKYELVEIDLDEPEETEDEPAEEAMAEEFEAPAFAECTSP